VFSAICKTHSYPLIRDLDHFQLLNFVVLYILRIFGKFRKVVYWKLQNYERIPLNTNKKSSNQITQNLIYHKDTNKTGFEQSPHHHIT